MRQPRLPMEAVLASHSMPRVPRPVDVAALAWRGRCVASAAVREPGACSDEPACLAAIMFWVVPLPAFGRGGGPLERAGLDADFVLARRLAGGPVRRNKWGTQGRHIVMG